MYFWSRLLVHTIIYHFIILFEGVSLTFGVKGTIRVTLQKIQNIYFKFLLSVVI